MKKYLSGTLAILLAFAALAFSKPAPPRNTAAGYWFPYNSAGTVVLDVSTQPVLTSTDPFGCSGSHINCAQENDSYSTISPTDFAPAGNILQTDKRD